MAATQSNFNILFILFGIRWIDFCIFGSDKFIKIISWGRFWLFQFDSHISIELLCKIITIVYSENSFEDFEIHWKIEIFPCVMIIKLSYNSGHFLPFQENSLRNSTVLDFRFSDENSLIWQIIVDFDFSNPIVFESAFHNVFLEVSIKSQNFSIILDPRSLNSWNWFVFGLFSLLLEAKRTKTFC